MNDGRRRELYHFRDEQGLEVDFVAPGRSGAVALVELQGHTHGDARDGGALGFGSTS